MMSMVKQVTKQVCGLLANLYTSLLIGTLPGNPEKPSAVKWILHIHRFGIHGFDPMTVLRPHLDHLQRTSRCNLRRSPRCLQEALRVAETPEVQLRGLRRNMFMWPQNTSECDWKALWLCLKVICGPHPQISVSTGLVSTGGPRTGNRGPACILHCIYWISYLSQETSRMCFFVYPKAEDTVRKEPLWAEELPVERKTRRIEEE